MKKRFIIIVLYLILLTVKDAYACFMPIILLNTYEWVILIGFLAFLVAVSTPEKRNGVSDTVFFILGFIILMIVHIKMIYYTRLLFPGYLFVFTWIYYHRVREKKETDKKAGRLYWALPVLAVMIVLFPPPVSQLWCSVNCQCSLRNYSDALERYRKEHNRYPETADKLVTDHIETLPECKGTVPDLERLEMRPYKLRFGLGTVPYQYSVNDEGDRFTLNCRSNNHRKWGYPDGYPSYSSEFGLLSRPEYLEKALKEKKEQGE